MDFASTFRDWASETTNFPNHVVEMALAHAIGDKVEAAYRRGDLLAKRRQLAEAWSKYCTSPPPAGAVVPMRQASMKPEDRDEAVARAGRPQGAVGAAGCREEEG